MNFGFPCKSFIFLEFMICSVKSFLRLVITSLTIKLLFQPGLGPFVMKLTVYHHNNK